MVAMAKNHLKSPKIVIVMAKHSGWKQTYKNKLQTNTYGGKRLQDFASKYQNLKSANLGSGTI